MHEGLTDRVRRATEMETWRISVVRFLPDARRLWLLLLPLVWPALRPFYSEGLPRSFDGGLHLLRLALLDRAVSAGLWLPRWSSELLLGFGYPLFNFYAPGAYYVAELFQLGGFSAYWAFIAAFCVAVLFAGIGMYWLALAIYGPGKEWAALLAAVAYAYAPYLLTNVYIRGALSEATAQALLPWIFWTTRCLLTAERPSRYYLPSALTLGALAITHNITLLFVPPLLVVYILVLWLPHRRIERALWIALSLATAMGISAFFWLPLLIERRYLADTAYEISRSVWLPGSMWTWTNFLDGGFTYEHTFARPIRVGLVQIGLAVGGFVLAGRRNAEWLLWLLVAVATGLFMGKWAVAIWQSSELLSVAQFAWRLLSVHSLALALGAGYIVTRGPRLLRYALFAVVVVVIILSMRPRLAWMKTFAPAGVDLTTPVFANIEIDKGVLEGGEGNSSIQEFRPLWAPRTLALTDSDLADSDQMGGNQRDGNQTDGNQTGGEVEIALQSAGLSSLRATVTSAVAMPLRLASFYFPGWHVWIDGAETAPYPSTNLGLLTIDMPAGEHTLEVKWLGTPLQRGSTVFSLVALVIAIALGWRGGSKALAASMALGLVVMGFGISVAGARHPGEMAVERPAANALGPDGLTFVAYRYEQVEGNRLHLYPYWYVQETPSASLRLHWQLLNEEEQVIAEVQGLAYFNTHEADLWPAGTLVDDAYQLVLPPGLAAGSYSLMLQWGDAERFHAPVAVGEVQIAQDVPQDVTPAHVVDVQFGASIRLEGYDLAINGRGLDAASGEPKIVRSGQKLTYTLYWRGIGPIETNYHGFVHLTDVSGQPLVQEDHMPGPLFQPPLLWSRNHLAADVYPLRIPEDAPSAFYWPDVGLYDFERLDRLPVVRDGQETEEVRHQLPPVKIVNMRLPGDLQAAEFAFGEFAELAGYSITPESGVLHPGERLGITLVYRSRTPTPENYVRFFQVLDHSGRVVAQHDNIPRAGGNPTWTWQPGEIIVDPVEVQLAGDAAPGTYALYMGFYPQSDPAARVPVIGPDGESIAERWAQVGSVVVE
jgi:hypothetical protein